MKGWRDPGQGRTRQGCVVANLVVGGDNLLLSLLGVHQHVAYPGIRQRSILSLLIRCKQA